LRARDKYVAERWAVALRLLLRLIITLYARSQNMDYMVHTNMKQLSIPAEFELEFKADTRLMSPDF